MNLYSTSEKSLQNLFFLLFTNNCFINKMPVCVDTNFALTCTYSEMFIPN